MSSTVESLLRTLVSQILTERRRKPGGPRTQMGALRQLRHDTFVTRVRSAVNSASGDVEGAARSLDVSPRTLYHYLSDDPGLASVETSSERGESDDDSDD